MKAQLLEFFIINRLILTAIDAQAFYTLGLAVALQWRRESRLELARSVPLLAAFGIGTAVALWGDIFIPSQTYLSPAVAQSLSLAQLAIMLVSAGFLLHFGARLNWSDEDYREPLWAFVAALGAILAIFWLRGTPLPQLRLWGEWMTRLLVTLPGALLAAWGLRVQAQRIGAMRLPSHIVGWLRVAGFAFGLYAIAGGLFVPLSVAGETWLDLLFGIPPQVLRIVAGAVLAVAMSQALTIFRHELQRLVTEMGRRSALAADRQRIGRDLHDGTIQAIYGTGLMLDNIAHLIPHDPDTAVALLHEVTRSLDTTIQDVRRYIHDLSEDEGELAEALGQLAGEFRERDGLAIDYRIEGDPPKLPETVRMNLLQMVREALTNVSRHSGADHAAVLLRNEGPSLRLVVQDNGRGLPPGGAYRPGGHGVPNLVERARLMAGHVHLSSRPGEGTVVEIEVPVPIARNHTADSVKEE